MAQVVTVACKLPNGLVLQNRDKDGRPTWTQTILGTAVKRDPLTMLPLEGNAIVSPTGFALTQNVDADQFELWMVEHHEMACVRNGLLFAQAKRVELDAEMKDNAGQPSGLEPMPQTAKGIEKMKD